MTPRELLNMADLLLRQPPTVMGRCWQRACAFLVRVALEQALRTYWLQVEHTAAGRPMRTQLLTLPVFAGAEIASIARACWYGLSSAAHHHSYELPPTAAELRDWHREVTALVVGLESRSAS
jgi:hypothetical protein